MEKNKYIVLCVILVVVVVGVLIDEKIKRDRVVEPQVVVEDRTLRNLYVPPEQLPERFPADFPIESGAGILTNYNYENAESIQATRKFISAKTLAANYTFYQKYLKDNGWTVSVSSNSPEVKYLSATKNGATLAIQISANSITKDNTVEATFVFKK